MKEIKKLILLLVSFSSFSQQNLIPNGSFEEVRTDLLTKFQDGLYCLNPCEDKIVTSHLGTGVDREPSSLVKYWWHYTGNTGINTSTSYGISYLISPNLFTPLGGADYIVDYIYGATNIFSFNNGLRAFTAQTSIQDVPSLRLQTNPSTNLKGFDCSPPDTKFGVGMNAPHGTNYMAIFDFRRGDVPGSVGGDSDGNALASKPVISVELKEKLMIGSKYTFEMTRAQMNLLDEIKSNEGWSSVKDAKIEVRIGTGINAAGELLGSNDYKIMEETFSYENWETDTWTFTATKEYKYLIVKVNPVGSFGNKIGGVFIDNLKLYLKCEELESQCLNENYRDEMLDVGLETFEWNDPSVFPDPSTNNTNGYLKRLEQQT